MCWGNQRFICDLEINILYFLTNMSCHRIHYLFTEYLNITCSVYIVRIIYDENIWNPRKGKEKISVTPTPYVGLVPTEFGILSRKLDRSCQGVTITQISGDGANMLSAQTRLNSPVVIAINTCIGKNKTWYIFVFLRGFT